MPPPVSATLPRRVIDISVSSASAPGGTTIEARPSRTQPPSAALMSALLRASAAGVPVPEAIGGGSGAASAAAGGRGMRHDR